MFCPNCGTEISDNALFCFGCGNAIEVDLSKRKSVEVKEEKETYNYEPHSNEEEFSGGFDRSYKPVSTNNENFTNNKNVKILIGVGIGVIIAIIILILILIILFKGKKTDNSKENIIDSVEHEQTVVGDLSEESKFEKSLSDYTLKKHSLDIFNYLVSDRWSLEHERHDDFSAYWFTDEKNATLSIATYHPDDPNMYRKLDSESLKYGCANFSLASDDYEIVVDTYFNGDFQGYIYTTQGYSNMGYWGPDVENRLEYAVWLSPDNKYSGEIQMLYPVESDYDYHEEFLNVINNIECLSPDYCVGTVSTSLDNLSNNHSNYSELSTSNSNNVSTGVSPEVKELLDSYEVFMDKYIDYMNKVESGASTTTLLADYYDILAQYEDYGKKLQKLENSNMSEADYEYYIEVTGRVNKKLLNASIQ